MFFCWRGDPVGDEKRPQIAHFSADEDVPTRILVNSSRYCLPAFAGDSEASPTSKIEYEVVSSSLGCEARGCWQRLVPRCRRSGEQ